MSYIFNTELKGEFATATDLDGNTWIIPFWNVEIDRIVRQIKEEGTISNSVNFLPGDLNDSDGYNVFLKKKSAEEYMRAIEKELDCDFRSESKVDLKELSVIENPIIQVNATITTETLMKLAQDSRVLGVRPMGDPKSNDIYDKLDTLEL